MGVFKSSPKFFTLSLQIVLQIFENFISGENICVQSQIERPHVYILARCPSTELQLAYTGTRLEDIEELKDDIVLSNSVKIKDIMRFFKGIKQLTYVTFQRFEIYS